MGLFKTLFYFLNNPETGVPAAHSCTGQLQISTLENPEALLPSNRLVAVTGPAGGILPGSAWRNAND